MFSAENNGFIEDNPWTWSGCFFFATTIASTIGYGTGALILGFYFQWAVALITLTTVPLLKLRVYTPPLDSSASPTGAPSV